MRTRRPTDVATLEPPGDGGIHLAIDLSEGSALTWVAGELAVALDDLGCRVSIPRTRTVSRSLEQRLRSRLFALMAERPRRTCHVRLNHYRPQFLMQETSGDVDAELFVTNYRFRGETRPLDMWSRNLATNGVRKLPLSSFCRESLQDLGVPADRCSVVAPGYSPEIESLYPGGKPPIDGEVRRLLVVTNSHDLPRYGTDILVPALAKAFGPHDPVEIHVKDYGASSGSRELRDLVASQPSFPRVVWHEQFLAKQDLIRLYGRMHLMVSPFRGEGYAMKIIDAMAAGLPVMMPAFGGPLEYAPAGGFLPIEFDEVPVGRCLDTDQYLVGPGAYWAQPREESLVRSLRSFLADPSAAENAASVARAHVFGRYTWRNAARSLVQAVERWRAEADAARSRRRRPSTVPLSVIVPTKDRLAELGKTLSGYAAQGEQSFEVVVVNDHGDVRAVQELVGSFGTSIRARVIDNDGRVGPGAARNRGLEEAEGEVFLVTGDDIVPAADLVARHLAAHRQRPHAEDAFVGKVDWHPDIRRGWLTDHIVGAGAQQFNFQGLRDGQEVPFDRFYTSNVSWKRALTSDLEQVFSESFRHAAYEDIELGHRLSTRGMKLRFLSEARGFHLHPMTVRSFLERMRRVGSMRTVLAAMHPCLVGSECLKLHQELEVERRRRIARGASTDLPSWESAVEPMVATLERLDAWSAPAGPLDGAAAAHVDALEERVWAIRRALFDDLCETFLAVGQAQEWAQGSPEASWAPAWIAMLHMAERAREPRAPALPPPPQVRLKQAMRRIPLARAAAGLLRAATRGRTPSR